MKVIKKKSPGTPPMRKKSVKKMSDEQILEALGKYIIYSIV